MNNQQLTDLQRKFLYEYLTDFNATQAAIRAGYSKKTAAAAASRLLRNVKVQEELQKLQKEIYSNSEIEIKNIIEHLADIAFYDVNDYLEVEEGIAMKLRDIEALPPCKRKAIKTIKNGKFGIEIDFCDRTKALEKLMDYFGISNGKGAENDDEDEQTGIVMLAERNEKPSDDDLLNENGEYIQL